MGHKMKHLLLGLLLGLSLVAGGSSGQYDVNGYSNPVYSTLSKSESNSGSNAATGYLDTVSSSANNQVNSLVDGSTDQTQRSNTNNGVQGAQSQAYYYEMYPQQSQYAVPKAGQKCVYTDSGMKCQYRRDGGSGIDSYGQQGGYGATGYDEGNEGGDGGLGGLSGLIGLLGLGGLKGLKALAPFSFLLPFLPILLPILLPKLLLLPLLPIIILLLPLLLLFLPIPVIAVPNGRSFKDLGNNTSNIASNIARMATDVFESEECVERISCEMARISRASNDWIDRFSGLLPKEGKIVTKVKRGLIKESNKSEVKVETSRMNSGGTIIGGENNCSRFTCNPTAIISKQFKNKKTN